MSNGSNPNTNFGRQDGVNLQTYFENQSRMLSEAIKQQIDDLEEKIDLRFQANTIALDKAESTNNTRLDRMNEFRDAMKDQTTRFLTKEEYQVRHNNLEEKIESVEKIVYMGVGAVFILELAFKFFIK